MPTRIGSRTASKVGRGFKVSIPPEISEEWELNGGENLIIYADKMDGEIVMIVSKEPLEDDILGN